jgi:hypothetical protein
LPSELLNTRNKTVDFLSSKYTETVSLTAIQMSCHHINFDGGENGETRTIYLAFIASVSINFKIICAKSSLNGVGPSILGTKTDSCLMRKLNSSSSNKNSRLCKITIARQFTVCQKVGNKENNFCIEVKTPHT